MVSQKDELQLHLLGEEGVQFLLQDSDLILTSYSTLLLQVSQKPELILISPLTTALCLEYSHFNMTASCSIAHLLFQLPFEAKSLKMSQNTDKI